MVDNGVEASTATVTSARGLRLSPHAVTSGAHPGGSPLAVGGHSVATASAGGQQRFDEDVSLPLIKVVVLGAPGVGKTSIVKRFVANEFSHEHRKTKKKSEYFPSLILNDSLFELKLIDLPVIQFFPADTLTEWADYRYYGLRSASAYLLVYDVSVPSTFHYVKALREQMYESKNMTNIPVIVVANKMDLVASTKNAGANPASLSLAPASNHHHDHHHHHRSGLVVVNLGTATASTSNGGPANGSATAAMMAASAASMHHPTSHTEVHHHDRKEISHMVRKIWRSAHVECSAKYNWNIVSVFRELAITLDMVANGQVIGSNTSVRKKRCLVF